MKAGAVPRCCRAARVRPHSEDLGQAPSVARPLAVRSDTVLLPLIAAVRARLAEMACQHIDASPLLAPAVAVVAGGFNDSTLGERPARLPPGHVTNTRSALSAITDKIVALLHAPIVTRARHAYTARGRRECAGVEQRKIVIEAGIRADLNEISRLCEEMKSSGLPTNEASRMRANFTGMLMAYETLLSIKSYRTPLGIRTFARAYIMLTPVVYGPYYAYLAGAGDHDGIGLPFACAFSVLTSMAMEGIFAIRLGLEDPFNMANSPDAIDVEHELRSIRGFLDPPAKAATVPASPSKALSTAGRSEGYHKTAV